LRYRLRRLSRARAVRRQSRGDSAYAFFVGATARVGCVRDALRVVASALRIGAVENSLQLRSFAGPGILQAVVGLGC
jgi:hypothetical protein